MADKTRRTVQFDISARDDADLEKLIGDVMARTTAARILFMYGLENSSKAFAAYAKPFEDERRKRIEKETEGG